MTQLYIEKQEKSGFKVGDHVKIIRIAQSFEEGWETVWRTNMNCFIDKECIILEDKEHYGFLIAMKEDIDIGKNNTWTFPYFVLEKWDVQPTVDMSKYNTICDICGKPAYCGLLFVECSGGCK